MKSAIWNLSKEDFAKLIERSSSFREVLLSLELTNRSGGTWRTLKKRIKEENVNCSHIYANKSKYNTTFRRLSSDEIFVENSKHSRNTAKRRIIKDNLMPYVCSKCGIGPEWNGKKMTLILDHKNGINNDHRLENLRFLCPNCNSQTDTFGSKSPGYVDMRVAEVHYCGCGVEKSTRAKTCRKCMLAQETHRPDKEVLEKLIWEIPSTQIAKMYGVSDKAICKWCGKYGIEKPKPGYWRKLRTKG